ncbi:PAS domain-containing protein [Streptomyces sp. NPDC003943]
MAAEQDAPTAAAVVDPDGMVSGWSEGGRLLLGWTAEETVGRPLTDLLVDRPRGSPENLGIGSDPSGVVPLRHRDGSTLDAVLTAHPLRGADGRSLGHVVTVQQWGRRPVIADRAFEQCLRSGRLRPRAAISVGQCLRVPSDGALRGAGAR